MNIPRFLKAIFRVPGFPDKSFADSGTPDEKEMIIHYSLIKGGSVIETEEVLRLGNEILKNRQHAFFK